MKKSRPGVLLTVLAEPARAGELEALMFAETTTFGVRRHEVGRAKLERRFDTVETAHGRIRVKVGSRGGPVVTVSPEFEDCRAAAAEHDVPVRVVIEAAAAAWRRGQDAGDG